MAAPCTCPNGQHDGRFPYCSGASGGPIVIERSRTNRAEIIDPRDERIAQLEAEVARVQGIAFGGFVAGAKWWEYKKTGATMWGSDVDDAEKAASERYPYAPHPLVVEANAQRDAALSEVARLEALIVEAVATGPGHIPDSIYNEARSIRSRVP